LREQTAEYEDTPTDEDDGDDEDEEEISVLDRD